MSIADRSQYVSRRNGTRQRVATGKNNLAGMRENPGSLWVGAGLTPTGSIPSTAVAPTNATAGAIGQLDSTSTQRVLRVMLAHIQGVGTVSSRSVSTQFLLVDRLSHQGGLSGTTTGAQTTNLPTAALTRYTSGVGVQAALEIYLSVGSTLTTAAASYTNDAGVAGQTSEGIAFGGTSATQYGINGSFMILSLQSGSGDKGVRAVASVTLAATTGTTGNFGVTLFYPVLAFQFEGPHTGAEQEALFSLGAFPVVQNGACLAWVTLASDSSGNQGFTSELTIAED